jgi:hypothetical protein
VGVQGLGIAAPVLNPRNATPPWTPDFEDFHTVPIAACGDFQFSNGASFNRVQNVQLQLSLQAPPAPQEMVVGSYYPHDITPLQRRITVQFTAFYKDPTLWRQLYYSEGSTWSPAVWDAGTFNMYFETAANVVDNNTVPARIGFRAQNMHWVAQPQALRGGDVIVEQVTGTVLDAGSGEDWSIYLCNNVSSYVWPT